MKLVLTFLIAITPPLPKPSKASKKSAKKKKGEIEEPVVQIDPEIPVVDGMFIRFEVTNPLSYLHIEYQLVPEKVFYEIDVLVWKFISKVYTSDGIRVIRNINRGDCSWVYFSINHEVIFVLDEVISFHDHTIEILITSNKSKLGSRALEDFNQYFFTYDTGYENDTTNFNKRFYPETNSILRLKMADFQEFFLDNLLNLLYTDTFVNFCKYCPDRKHQLLILKEIESVTEKDFIIPVVTGADIIPLLALANKGKPLEGKQKKKSKKPPKFDGNIKILLKAEELFEEKSIIVKGASGGPEGLRYGGIFVSVKDVLTPSQRRILQPLVIRIRSVENLPVKVLQENSIDYIYACYKAFDVYENATLAYPLQKNIYFDDVRTVLASTIEPIKILQFIQLNYLEIEIRGIRSGIIPLVFGEHKLDPMINRPFTLNSIQKIMSLAGVLSPSIVLAVAKFNLSTVITYNYVLDTTATCTMPHVGDCADYIIDLTKQQVTKDLMDINITRIYPPVIGYSPLTTDILLEEGTSVSVKSVLMSPLKLDIIDIVTRSQPFNRLYMEITNFKLFNKIFRDVVTYNKHYDLFPRGLKEKEEFFDDEDDDNHDVVSLTALNDTLRMDKMYSLSTVDSSERMLEERAKNCLTGFVLTSDEDNFMVYLEGLANGYIQHIWMRAMDMAHEDGRVFYNSERVFECRRYKELIDHGGIVLLYLKKPMNELMQSSEMYTRDCPLSEGLRRIHNIGLETKFVGMLKCCLFPSSGELLAIYREVGTPWPFEYTSQESIETITSKRESIVSQSTRTSNTASVAGDSVPSSPALVIPPACTIKMSCSLDICTKPPACICETDA